MSPETTEQRTNTKPRRGYLAAVLTILALLSIGIVFVAELDDRKDRRDLVNDSMERQIIAVSGILSRQIHSGLIAENQLDEMIGTFAGTFAMRWARLLPANTKPEDMAFVSTPLAEDLQAAIASENIAQIQRTASSCSGTPVTAVETGNYSLTGCRISNGDILAVLFYRPALYDRADAYKETKWLALIGLVFATVVFTHLASQHLLQKSVRTLSEALDKSEDSLILTFDEPIRDKQVHWLANHLSNWLGHVKESRKELEGLALVAETTERSVLVLNAQFGVEWVNDSFMKMTGYSLDEIKGRSPRDFMRGPDTDPAVSARVDNLISAGRPISFETQAHRKDGTSYWINAEMQPVRNEQGQLNGWIAVTADISERKNTEEELANRVAELEAAKVQQEQLTRELENARKEAESNSKAKSDFLANMSHEIRTPMNGVLGMADVLLTTSLSTSQRDYIQTIKDSGAALLTILNDILDLSKLEAGKIDLEKESVDVTRLLNSVVDLMTPSASEKQLAVSAEIADDVPEIILEDGGRLRQVLLNLVGNAVKFTDEGSVVLSANIVTNKDGEAHLRFDVTDTGAGVAEEHKQKLFDRFEQAGSSGSDTGGTGLGLSICRELIWLMEGKITLESELKVGSTFRVEIPFVSVKTSSLRSRPTAQSQGAIAQEAPVPNQAPAQAVAPAPAAASQGPGLNILLAEDHPVNQSLMKAFVRKLGHEVTVAEDGVEAVKAIRDGTFDLVLMDIQMPRMDGVMATKVIRSLENAKASVPIIAVTANAMAGQRDHYLESGMNGYVSKPVQLAALEGEIQRVWAEHQTLDTRTAI